MRLLFTLLSALLLALAFGWGLQQSAGAVVFTYKEWVIQTSLIVFVIIASLLFLLAYALLRMLLKLLRAPDDFRVWSEYRRRRRSEKFLGQGLLALMEGDWQEAERSLRKGAAFSQTPAVNYLGAAQAAYRRGDTERYERYLKLAQQHDETDGMAPGLARARLQLDLQQTEQANNTLGALTREHERATLMLLEAATARQDWQQANRLLEECRRRRLLPRQQGAAQQAKVYAGLLREAGEKQDLTVLQDLWQSIPNRLKKDNALLGAYVEGCLRHGDAAEAEPMLRRALKKRWDPELALLFGHVKGRDLKRQLKFAESLLSGLPEDPVLLLTLGRLCKQNLLWGKARSYLELSAQIRPDPATAHELADLAAQQDERSAALTHHAPAPPVSAPDGLTPVTLPETPGAD